MAHVDASVFERRLRPIYDSLEVGNNKKALQEVEKLLKKSPTLTCAHALKALALLRLGREDESNAILKTITLEKTSDDATMQVLSFCYREMEQLEKICELYSHAAKQYPGNEEILAQLFISYVRLDDYKSQQYAALQLYKAAAKNPYYYWAVMSVVLQGVRGPESSNNEKRNLYLSLAQKMVEKMITENKIDGEQEVQLYLSILHYQKKYAEAFSFLEGPTCQKYFPGAPVSLKINLLKLLGKWAELNQLLKNLLLTDRDRWDYYQDYIASVFELHRISEVDENGCNLMDNCQDFLCQLMEAERKKVRGPYLARLELHKQMRANNLNAAELLGEFSDLIIEYYHLFGDKPCCTLDISLFLSSVCLEERIILATRLLKESGITAASLPQGKLQMQKHICSLQVSRICGGHINLGLDHSLALYTALKLHYENGFSAFGKELLSTDMGPSDAYALLAANIMFDLTLTEKNSKYLMEAVYLLQYVLKNSPSNFHVKLLLLKSYHYLGCIYGAQQIYDLLDIKHIQLDSMGYLHCALLSQYGHLWAIKSVYETTLKFFTNSYKERLEYIAMSYKFGSFTKLVEFMDFRDRLWNSIHYATISAEELLLELITLSGGIQQNLNTFKLMSIKPSEDRISWDELADNRDLSVVINWDPMHIIDKCKETEQSFVQQKEALRLRSLLLRITASFIDLLHFPEKINTENCLKTNAVITIQNLKNNWAEHFSRIREMNYEKPANQFLVTLLPSRLHSMLTLPYEKFITLLSEFTIELYNGNLESNRIEDLNAEVTKLESICSNTIENYNKSDDNLWIYRNTNHQIYGVIEILALYAFVLSAYHEKYSQTSSQNIHNKKAKRKDSKRHDQNNSNSSAASINDKQRLQATLDLMRHLKQQLQNCYNSLALWKTPTTSKELEKCMADLSLRSDTEALILNDIIETFKENHIRVVTDLRNIIKDKIRMVNK
ncbi:phagocyte signaling-impaired protein [Condylostylus longicornis]|uniref:phagocyte signaling-impaired protein n=1 Tax=Condylostylus longicornis TaxID=2530218 RepID=UPI00244E1C52|nr:phagocyte signaling-impaired protein [Condylostylus longicornis]